MLEKKAEIWHFLIIGLAVIGINFIILRVAHRNQPVDLPQSIADVSSIVVIGA